jgi:hypothetical protein
MITGFQAGVMGTYGELWTPANITTELWFDAADSSTITLNGSAVAQWADKSGNARHINATGTQQPAYNATGLNSAGLITFDGSNDILSTTAAGCNGVTNCSMFTVMRYIAVNGEDITIAINRANPPNPTYGLGRYYYRNNGSSYQGFGTWSQDVVSSSIAVDTGGSHHVFGAVQSGLNVDICRDGIAAAYTIPTGGSKPINTNDFSLGGTLNSANYYANVSMAETVIFYSAIDSTTRQKIEGYLAHKWGLTGSLPSDHPYRYSAPTV